MIISDRTELPAICIRTGVFGVPLQRMLWSGRTAITREVRVFAYYVAPAEVVKKQKLEQKHALRVVGAFFAIIGSIGCFFFTSDFGMAFAIVFLLLIASIIFLLVELVASQGAANPFFSTSFVKEGIRLWGIRRDILAVFEQHGYSVPPPVIYVDVKEEKRASRFTLVAGSVLLACLAVPFAFVLKKVGWDRNMELADLRHHGVAATGSLYNARQAHSQRHDSYTFYVSYKDNKGGVHNHDVDVSSEMFAAHVKDGRFAPHPVSIVYSSVNPDNFRMLGENLDMDFMFLWLIGLVAVLWLYLTRRRRVQLHRDVTVART